MLTHIRLPGILYLCILDRLADSWEYGAIQYPYAWWHYMETMELAEQLPARAHLARAAIRTA
jgi:hypothetical protein